MGKGAGIEETEEEKEEGEPLLLKAVWEEED